MPSASRPILPDVAKLMGWAYYGANKMDQAVAEWKRSEKLRPDPEVEHALEKAERDKAEEESYREGETAHFALKYNGSATPDLARGILHVLEDDFRDLESAARFHSARTHRRDSLYRAGLCGYHPRPQLGRRHQRRPHPHSRPGPHQRHARNSRTS